MDLLDGSDSETEDHPSTAVPVAHRADRRFLNSAPATSVLAARNAATALAIRKEVEPTSAMQQIKTQNGAVVLMNNPKKDVLFQPVQGPQMMDPQQELARSMGQKNGKNLERDVAFDETTFHEQRNAFQRNGQAMAPDSTGTIVTRTTLGYTKKRLEDFEKRAKESKKRPRFENDKPVLVEGDDDEATYGIWGPPTNEEKWHQDNTLSDLVRGGADALTDEQKAERAYLAERQKGLREEAKDEEPAIDRLLERKMAHLLPPKLQADSEPAEASTKFHGKEEYDYKGNSWMAPPTGMGSITEEVDVDHHRCYVPKKCVHRFTGHNKGVQRIRLFPKTAHLLLSAGLDGKCKVWSIDQRKVMRTYTGHTAAVRDVQFNHDGTKFVSASFDRYLRLWNTESGEVLQTFTNQKVPYVVEFYPHDDNFFVVGCSDNKIITYDATTGNITQEYNHHLAPVNSVIFVEDHGTKMISSSDDKKVLVWEWDIGVPIKYISDPTMHSMPSLRLHPGLQHFCGQSLDNQIVVFQASGRFTQQKKKKFLGHQVSGYACELSFSPDGRFLVSGDGNGKLFIWDYKKARVLQKYKAHDQGPAIATVWHPWNPSMVFTAGWDGVIKMWE